MFWLYRKIHDNLFHGFLKQYMSDARLLIAFRYKGECHFKGEMVKMKKQQYTKVSHYSAVCCLS